MGGGEGRGKGKWREGRKCRFDMLVIGKVLGLGARMG